MSNQTEALKDNVAKWLNNRINPPKDKVKNPMNRLWIALLAFNGIFLPLDIITAFAVGVATRWYYGLFVLGAGVGSMFVHEALFSNPYADSNKEKFPMQKTISIIGFLMSVFTTIVIGLAAIVVNLLLTGYNRELYGAAMAAFSFLILFGHGILIAAYYFTDHGIRSRQNATSALASHNQLMQDFALSTQIVDAINALEDRMIQRIEAGDGKRMGAALHKITGQDWIDEAESKSVSRPTTGER